MMLRLLLLCCLLCFPLLAFADGMSFGKAFPMLTETDQSAVIRLEPGKATVDMYIAIDGIPKGETITYILPFWHPVKGFRLEEMDGKTYEKRYVKAAHEQVLETLQLISGRAGNGIANGYGWGAVCFLGPFTGIWLPKLMGGSRQAHQLIPFEVAETVNARAELYKIGKDDLQSLIKKAGLPAKYSQPLKKYKTPYFAIMRLTGVGGEMGRGIHYHFTHKLEGQKSFRYIYPLGTGAAWPHPIEMTQVYIICPMTWKLTVKHPVEGMTFRHYLEFSSFYASFQQDGNSSAREDQEFYLKKVMPGHRNLQKPDSDLPYPVTSSALDMYGSDNQKKVSAWHVAYFMSNPNHDIVVDMSPRPFGWLIPVLKVLMDPISIFIIVLGSVILAWTVAGRLILYNQWKDEGSPGNFRNHLLNMASKSAILCIGITGILAASVFGLGILSLIFIVLLIVLLVFMVIAHRKEPAFLRRAFWPVWLIALIAYGISSVVMIVFTSLIASVIYG